MRDSATVTLMPGDGRTDNKPISLFSRIGKNSEVYRRNNNGPKAQPCSNHDTMLTRLLRLPSTTTSIEGASPCWMYPDSKQSRAKSPLPLLLLLAIRPGAAHPEDCSGTPGNQAIYCPKWGAGLLSQTGRGKTTTRTTLCDLIETVSI